MLNLDTHILTHDLAVFLPKVDGPILKGALERSFDFRSTELPKSFYAEIKKNKNGSSLRHWASAVESIPWF